MERRLNLFSGPDKHSRADAERRRKSADRFESHAEAALLDLTDEGPAEPGRVRELILSHSPRVAQVAQVAGKAVA